MNTENVSFLSIYFLFLPPLFQQIVIISEVMIQDPRVGCTKVPFISL